MMEVKTRKEVEKELKEKGITKYSILEEEDIIWVLTKEKTFKFLKPRKHEEIITILNLAIPPKPMEGFLKVLKSPIENKAYKAVRMFLKRLEDEEPKTNLLMLGSVGAGKTVCSILALYHFLRKRRVQNPLYVPVVALSFEKELNQKVIESDAFLIDDLNLSAGDYALSVAQRIILYALERNYPLLITSNNSYAKLQELFGQHLKSRIESTSMIFEIKDRDYRLEAGR